MKFLKHLAFLCAILMLFTACTPTADTPKDEETTVIGTTSHATKDQTTTEQPTEPAAPTNQLVELLKSNKYTIIRSADASEKDIASTVKLRTFFSEHPEYGQEDISTATDFVASGNPDEANPFEIILGSTNRSAAKVDVDLLENMDHMIAVVDSKIVIAGAEEYALENAIDEFIAFLSAETVSLPYFFNSHGQIEHLRVGSYNIIHGEYVDLDFTVIAKDIVDAGLDIVGLQEVDQLTSRNKFQDTVGIIAEEAGFPYYAFTKALNLGGGEYGTAILSKYPIKSHESFLLPITGDHEQRALGHAVLDVNGITVDFYNTHLGEDQTQQFGFLAEQLQGKEKYILTGDFNNNGYQQFKRLPNSNMSITPTDAVTGNYNTVFNSSKVIDHIVYSTGIELLYKESVNNKETDKTKQHSDHCMVFSEFIIRK